MTDRWTDDELDMDFEAAMLGVEPGQPGPGMAESDRLVRLLTRPPEDDE
jgi:hypothetical protein